MKLEGKIALITGASQGLGKEIAKLYLAEGAKVAICARDMAALDRAREDLERAASPQSVLAIKADVADEKAVGDLVRQTVAKFGGLDVLVNNAGVYGPMGPTETVDIAEWVQALHINLIGVLLPCRAAIPEMRARGGGKIINLSGGGATQPMPRISAYAASKAAVVRLTETLAQELAADRIDVNAIAPGALNTRLLDQVLAAGSETVGASFLDKALSQRESGGTPLAKGAQLSVYLASPESDGITGKLISAQWDPWASLQDHAEKLRGSDIYTLRRIVPEDRGEHWSE
jgi:3-oxoacyl-[acyl-carrier protein] reductase